MKIIPIITLPLLVALFIFIALNTNAIVFMALLSFVITINVLMLL